MIVWLLVPSVLCFGSCGSWRGFFASMAIQAQLYSENLGFPLCGSQDWVMDNGCGGVGGFNQIFSNPQQKQQLQRQHVQQLQNQQERNQNLFFENSSLTSTLEDNTNAIGNNSHLPMLYSQSIASQFEGQRQEIDQYIRAQVRQNTFILFSDYQGRNSIVFPHY